MIQIVIGVPRSGKTYYVVRELIKFAKSGTYKKIYTNINGLNYELLNQINPNVTFIPFKFSFLEEQIIKEYEFFVDNKDLQNYDEEAKKIGLYSDFYHSLIVLDEAHKFFPKKIKAQNSKYVDSYLEQFCTYHGHYNIDALLITQDKHSLFRSVLSNCDGLVVAQPSKNRFFSTGLR